MRIAPPAMNHRIVAASRIHYPDARDQTKGMNNIPPHPSYVCALAENTLTSDCFVATSVLLSTATFS